MICQKDKYFSMGTIATSYHSVRSSYSLQTIQMERQEFNGF